MHQEPYWTHVKYRADEEKLGYDTYPRNLSLWQVPSSVVHTGVKSFGWLNSTVKGLQGHRNMWMLLSMNVR